MYGSWTQFQSKDGLGPDAKNGGLRRFIVVVFILVFWPTVLNANELRLEGDHLVNISEDSPDFISKDYDDSGWTSIKVPQSLRAAGLNPRPDVYWYRIKFQIPPDWDVGSPALQLGIIDRSDETYLNGTLIGGEGQIGPRQSDWHSYAPITPRFYPFDAALLDRSGVNVIAIKAAREPYIDDGGIFTGPVAIVETVAALDKHLEKTSLFTSANNFLLGIETLLFVAILIILFTRQQQRAVWLFFGLYTAHYFGSLERRGFFALLGFDHPALQFAANVIPALSLPLLIAFVAYIFSHPVGRFGRFIQIGSLLTLISIPLTGIAVLDWWVMESALVWHLLLVLGLGLIVFWAIKAQIRRAHHAVPLLAGLSMLALCMIADMSLPANFIEASYGIRLGEIGIFALFLSIGLIVAQRIIRTEQALKHANLEVLTAHEQERARIARDIHDGIGQWLSSIRIRLEVFTERTKLGQSPTTDNMQGLTTDLKTAIDDTRRIVRDMSPIFLEEHGLSAAIKGHAQNTAKSNGCSIQVDIDADLAIEDDGRGFSAEEALDRTNENQAGIGLKTMRERARLLGGRLSVSSKPDAGILVELHFPL